MFSNTARRVALVLGLVFVLECLPLRAERPTEATSSVSVFDTGASSSAPLSGDALSRKDGWIRVPEEEIARPFKGDAVLMNDRLAVVLRRNGPGAEVYSNGTKGLCVRTVLTPTAAAGDVGLASVAVAENTPSQVAVDATFKAAGGKTLSVQYELGIGQVFVKTEARGGATGLCVEAPCRFVVLPDFFADDIVVDAAEIPVDRAELPSENFLLHMLGDGEAIVMAVSKDRQHDCRISLSGQDDARVITQTQFRYGKDGKIWVAVLEGRDVWHLRRITSEDAGKIITLDWRMPYPAQWRVDWRRADKLTGSWEMIAQKTDGEFEKHGWFGSPNTIPQDRKRWTTVLGRFEYPCWVDQTGQGYLQPLKLRRSEIHFQGPALIYPINRVSRTPLDEFTVVDVVRATLGVGPCQYILDVEGQTTAMKGRATCAVRDVLNSIYANRQQKYKKAEIERALRDVLLFVTHIRGRIENYVAFGHRLLAYLDEQKRAHPELAEFLGEMETLARAIDGYFQARSDKIKTTQYVAGLTDQFRRTLLDYEGDDALEKCRAITGAIVEVGGNQDELVGECRMAVKILRQRCGLAMAVDPRVAEIAKEIRRRTQQVLRNPASYEAPRH